MIERWKSVLMTLALGGMFTWNTLPSLLLFEPSRRANKQRGTRCLTNSNVYTPTSYQCKLSTTTSRSDNLFAYKLVICKWSIQLTDSDNCDTSLMLEGTYPLGLLSVIGTGASGKWKLMGSDDDNEINTNDIFPSTPPRVINHRFHRVCVDEVVQLLPVLGLITRTPVSWELRCAQMWNAVGV